MRIVEIITGLGLGGSETALARRLKYQPPGVRTTVVNTLPHLDHYSGQVRRYAQNLIDIEFSRISARSLDSLLRDSEPDVVVTHSPRETLRLQRVRLPNSLRHVAVVHSSSASPNRHHEWPVTALLCLVNHRIAMHVAVSGSAAQGHQCFGARRIDVVPVGAEIGDTLPFTSPWPPGTRVRLLTLSRLFRQKNVHSLIAAIGHLAPLMRSVGVHTCVFGDGDQRANLSATIERKGLRDLISLKQSISDPSPLLREADALIVPSTAEGGPITVYEALLAGTRVLSTPVGIVPDLFSNDSGLLIAKSPSVTDLEASLASMVQMEPVGNAEREQRAQRFCHLHTRQTSQKFYEAIQHA